MSPLVSYPFKIRLQLRFAYLCIFFLLALLAIGAVDSTGSSVREVAEEVSRGDSPSIEKLTLVREGFQKVLALNPTDADAHNGLGLVMMKLKEYDDAVGEFRLSLKLRPNSLQFANDLALALTKTG